MTDDQNIAPGGNPAGTDGGWAAGVVAAHGQVLFNLALRVLRSPDDAANALTDVFISTWRETPDALTSEASAAEILVPRTRDLVTRRRRARSAGRDDRPVDLDNLAKNLSARIRRGEKLPEAVAALGPALCGAISRSGSVTAALLSHVYFSGLTIAETAAAVSITPSECLSRLYGCLNMIAARTGSDPRAGVGCGFSVDRAAHALGALEPAGSPEFLDHLAAGCPDCAAEVSRLSRAAGKLAYLLPDMTIPAGLKEKIIFSLQLARVVSGDAAIPGGENLQEKSEMPGMPAPSAREDEAEPTRAAVPGVPDKARDRVARLRRRPGVLLPVGLGILALTLACGLAVQTSLLRETIDRQSYLIESVQTKNARMLVEHDRLAGVSGFFESGGVVAVLTGDSAFPGLAGKLVWDTAGNKAMLQILNFPPVLEGTELEVSVVREGRRERVAGFLPQAEDSGNVLYRFFPVEPGPEPLPSEFSVAALQDEGTGERVYRKIMGGSLPVRTSSAGLSGRE